MADLVVGAPVTIKINTLLVGTVMCERAFCDATLDQLQKVVGWMFGDELWSWEMAHPPIRLAACAEGYRQFPAMPSVAQAAQDLKAAIAAATDAYGPVLDVARGPNRRNAANGFDTFTAIAGPGGRVRMPMAIRRGARFG